jgi:hypothetical protein
MKRGLWENDVENKKRPTRRRLEMFNVQDIARTQFASG